MLKYVNFEQVSAKIRQIELMNRRIPLIIACFACLLHVYSLPDNLNRLSGDEWDIVQENKFGEITICYSPEVPFVYETEDGLAGIEVDILNNFANYLRKSKNIEISFNWVLIEDFDEFYKTVKNATGGVLGMGGVTIAPNRKKELQFSPSYLRDVSVLITHVDIPIAKSLEEIKNNFMAFTAVTTKGTTFEKDLFEITNRYLGNVPVKYVRNTSQITKIIAENGASFGYVSLPIYLSMIKEGMQIHRQNLFTKFYEGYGLIFPLNSQWSEPINEFFLRKEFQKEVKKIVQRHAKIDDDNLLDISLNTQKIDPWNNELAILNKENEIQNLKLSKKEDELNQQKLVIQFIFAFIALFLISVGVVVLFYRNQIRANRKIKEAYGQLKDQSEKIAMQNEEIQTQNELLEQQKNEIIESKKKLETANLELNEVNTKLEALVLERTDDFLKANNELTIANEELDLFIYRSSHDLKGPITRVLGLAQVAKLEVNEQTAVSYFDKFEGVALNMNILLNKLKMINLINKNQEEPILIDFQKLIEDVKSQYLEEITAKNILFESKIEKDLVFYANYELLKLIIRNLIENSIRYCKENDPFISVHVLQREENLVFSIKDNGIGIAQELHDDIFGMFFRGTELSHGNGLGLYLVKKAIKRLNGKIKVDSQFDEGASFTLTIPI